MIVYYGVIIAVLVFGTLAQDTNSKSRIEQSLLTESAVRIKII